MHKGDIIFIDSGVERAVMAEEDAILCHVRFAQEILAYVLGGRDVLFCCNSCVEDGRSYEELRRIFRELVVLYVYGDRDNLCAEQSLLYSMLGELTQRFMTHMKDAAVAETGRQLPYGIGPAGKSLSTGCGADRAGLQRTMAEQGGAEGPGMAGSAQDSLDDLRLQRILQAVSRGASRGKHCGRNWERTLSGRGISGLRERAASERVFRGRIFLSQRRMSTMRFRTARSGSRRSTSARRPHSCCPMRSIT